MSAQPTVAKAIWTDADFDAMGWHDNAVHAIALEHGWGFQRPGTEGPGRASRLRRPAIPVSLVP